MRSMNHAPAPRLAAPTPENIQAAAAALRAGALVAFATETVYGLGANALDAGAVARIFEVKGRPATNPLIVHVADEAAARQATGSWPREAELLARAFWPGPLTLVLPRAATIPDIITAGLDSVGVRVPSHAIALQLLRDAGIPIAAPSANRSEALSPTRAEHVLQSLGAWLDSGRDMILDGGACAVGIESSVLDLTQSPPVLLRPGAIARAQIEAVIGSIRVLGASSAEIDTPRASPGMMARHYAPRARALRFESRRELEAALAHRAQAKYLPRLGIVAVGEMAALQDSQALVEVRALGTQPEKYASRLYDILHELDEAGCEEIWVEMPPQREEWRAVRDRLARATVEG